MIELYKTDASPPSRAVMMVLTQLSLTVNYTEILPLEGDNLTPEYLAKNPLHTIPFIEDGDFKLADSHAINTYLFSKYGQDKIKEQLYPSDLETRATIDARMYLDASIMFPKIREILATLQSKKKVPTKEQLTQIKKIYGYLEIYLSKTKFVAADHVTLADVSVVSTISALDFVVPVKDFPKLSEWYTTLQQYDWYKTANLPGLEKILAFWKRLNDEAN